MTWLVVLLMTRVRSELDFEVVVMLQRNEGEGSRSRLGRLELAKAENVAMKLQRARSISKEQGYL